MNIKNIQIQIEQLDSELYSLEEAIAESFSHREEKELQRKLDSLCKKKRKLQKKLERNYDGQ